MPGRAESRRGGVYAVQRAWNSAFSGRNEDIDTSTHRAYPDQIQYHLEVWIMILAWCRL